MIHFCITLSNLNTLDIRHHVHMHITGWGKTAFPHANNICANITHRIEMDGTQTKTGSRHDTDFVIALDVNQIKPLIQAAYPWTMTS